MNGIFTSLVPVLFDACASFCLADLLFGEGVARGNNLVCKWLLSLSGGALCQSFPLGIHTSVSCLEGLPSQDLRGVGRFKTSPHIFQWDLLGLLLQPVLFGHEVGVNALSYTFCWIIEYFHDLDCRLPQWMLLFFS